MVYVRKVDLALDIAKEFLGRPYVWGGDDPIAGFDCSGFIVEILKSVGLLPSKGDWTAHGLYELYKERVVTAIMKGCLVFWDRNKDNKMDHVEMVFIDYLDGDTFTIGASGGGSRTMSLRDAIEQNAYIKIRPMPSNHSVIVNPFWE